MVQTRRTPPNLVVADCFEDEGAARASRKPSIIPAGPPPTTQHFVVIGESAISAQVKRSEQEHYPPKS
jgi:hypothetical protein